jgi:hypothetical protein
MQNYNFVCGFVWVWNLVSDIKWGTWTKNVREQGVDEIICTEESLNEARLEKTA